MIFVRCRHGLKHAPMEAVTSEDAFLGVRVMYKALNWSSIFDILMQDRYDLMYENNDSH
jgi:hypothetical protein